MKTLSLILFAFLPITGVFCQDNFLAKLPVSGGISELGVSPNEELWFATKTGNVYYTRQIGQLWHLGPFGSLDKYAYSSGNLFERLNVLSEDTMMLSGFTGNTIEWSGDHGKSWQKISFGKDSWIDACYANNHGKIWMSGSSQLIYYSNDYGKTWRSFDKVEATGNLRFSTIHFSPDDKVGLFGSFWNVLYRTIDNCQTWEKLPTPLSQDKYQRLSKSDRPDIRKIRIYGDNYIINQQGKVYISKSDSINWVLIPDAENFEVTESKELFIIHNDLSISKYDTHFSSVWKSEQKLQSYPLAITVRNNKLFVLGNEMVYKIDPNEFISSRMLTDEVPIDEPYTKVTFEDEEYGFEDQDILQFDKAKQQWKKILTADFNIRSATIFDNQLVVSNYNLTHVRKYDKQSNSLMEYRLPDALFSESIVAEILFEQGSQGCFHMNNSSKTYKKKGDKFLLDNQSSTKNFLPNSAKEISPATIQQLIQLIDRSKFSKVSIGDLKIGAKDISAYKTMIDSLENDSKSDKQPVFFRGLYSLPGENVDFNFYRSVADSLSLVDPEEINKAFWRAYGNWSTTRNWTRVTFVLQNGKEIVIENGDDVPNYLFTPWHVNYDGLHFGTNSILLGEQINTITGGDFFDQEACKKKYAIFKIVDYLYRKKLAI